MNAKLLKGRIGLGSVAGVSVAVVLLLALGSAAGPVYPLVSAPPALIKLHAAIELTSGAPHTNGTFGTSVAASGNYVAVGAPSEPHAGHAGAGNVYVYNSSTGQLIASIGSPNPKFQGLFGYALAMSGPALVVGAPNETARGTFLDAGNAYLYSISGGTVTLQHTLPEPVPQAAPAGQLGGTFGYSVALSGTNVLVGAPNETSLGTVSAGDAYIFSTAGAWVANLTTPNPTAYGFFGLAVAMAGTTAFVGAPSEGSGGHAYIVLKATGPISGRTTYVLASPGAQLGANFGTSLAVSGGNLVVGAYYENITTSAAAGNVYVFNSSTGLFARQLINPDPQYYGWFGWSVAASGADIVVGAVGDTVLGQSSAGNVSVFNASSGKLVDRLVSPNFQSNGIFGYSVAADAACIVVGASAESVGSHASGGHAYIF